MKANLIEITRDKTNFFTGIFIYDNKKKVPKKIVEVAEIYNDDNKYILKKEEKFVVFFKDLETDELLEFYLDRDSELLNKEKIKSTNKFLIEKMQEFVRLNYYHFINYYENKNKTVKELSNLIKIENNFTLSNKLVRLRYKLTDEIFWLNQMTLNTNKSYVLVPKTLKELHKFFYPRTEIFRETICKCLLWSNCKVQVENWKENLVRELSFIAHTISNWYKENSKRAFNEFFNKYLDDWDIECAFKQTQNVMGLYFAIDYKRFGAPNIVDYKQVLKVYRKFKREYYNSILDLISQSKDKLYFSNQYDEVLKIMVEKYLELANQKCIVGKQNKYIKEKDGDREVRIIEVEGKEIKLEYSFFFVLPIEEIDERMKQLKHETVKNSLFISGEEFCNRYFNSLLGKNHEQYAEFIAKMCDYDELIIRHAQFLKGKDNTIEVLKTILAIREDMQKTTAIFTSEENFGL